MGKKTTKRRDKAHFEKFGPKNSVSPIKIGTYWRERSGYINLRALHVIKKKFFGAKGKSLFF